MRVALLLSGQPRFIDDERPFSFFNENVIKKYNADVYCHAWFERGAKIEKSPWSKNAHRLNTTSSSDIDNPIPENADEIIVSKYKPKKYKFEHPRNFKFLPDSEAILDLKFTGKHHEGYFSKTGYSCILSQLKSMQECFDLVDKEKYDLFVLSRYDVTITNFLNDLDLLDHDYMHLQNIHDRFPDGIYIFSKKYFDWFRNLFDEVQTKNIVSNIPYPSTEQFKRTSFSLNYGMKFIKSHPMRINILRK